MQNTIEESAIALAEELSSFLTKDPNMPDVPPDEAAHASALSRSFRHSFWCNRRTMTEQALLRADVPYKQITRFRECGSQAFVYRSEKTPDKLMIKCDRCKNRWCEACNRERRTIIQRNLRANYPKARTRFLTLTVKSQSDLRTVTDHLFKSWQKLRRQKQYAKRITGGIWFLELTRNVKTNEWHPHLHIVYTGSYLDHTKLSKDWHNITGDSFVVDIREIPNPEIAIGYVTKYASKAIPREVWSSVESMAELIRDYKDQKLIGVFGTWRGLKLTQIPESDEGWTPVAPLWKIISYARMGIEWATKMLNDLGRYVPNAHDHANTPDPNMDGG